MAIIFTAKNTKIGLVSFYSFFFHLQNAIVKLFEVFISHCQLPTGMDENLGPVAISIRREKISPSEAESNNGGSGHHHGSHHHNHHNQQKDQNIYRIIIRTSELATLRGTVLEEAIPSLKPPGPKGLSLREVLDMVSPEIHLPCLRLAIPGQTTEQQLLKLDQQGLSNHYKVGILYCKAGQSTEEEMYNNEEGGPAFDDFLNLIGQRVRLRGFEKYKAGLDNKMDSTGLYSLYSQYQDRELMFHVSSLLPFTPNNRQQLLRKRHIGNDIVTVVFQEPGALPFSPKNIRSQFQHVFIIVRVLHPCTDHTQYQVAVSRSKEVPIFGPPIPAGATFSKSQAFVDFLLAKIINAEHAAHRSQKFATMATRTRQEYLKVIQNFAQSKILLHNISNQPSVTIDPVPPCRLFYVLGLDFITSSHCLARPVLEAGQIPISSPLLILSFIAFFSLFLP